MPRLAMALRGAIGVALCAAAGCAREDAPSTVSSGEAPTQILRDFKTTESDSGRVRYVMRAQIARVYANNVTRAEVVHVEFYNAGKQVSVLTAREGVLEGGRMTAIGDVVVTSTDGTRLQTESLFWDQTLQKIRSEEFVRITRQGDAEVLTGRGLTSDPDLEFIDIGEPQVSGPVESERR